MATIVDRRQIKNTHAINIKKYFNRHHAVVRDAILEKLLDKDIKDTSEEVKIKIKIEETEPSITQEPGNFDTIFVGNRKYKRGDRIPKKEQGSGGGGGEGTDYDYTPVHLSREDLDEYLFSECELPNYIDKFSKEVKDFKMTHSGFKKCGLPANIDIRRSFKNSIGRQAALTFTYEEEIEKLKNTQTNTEEEELDKLKEIADLIELKNCVPFIDELDLRFRFKEFKPNYITKGVVYFVLDVSGSMDERRKEIAKLFFILTKLFLDKFYDSIDVKFIKHATEAQWCSEEKFYKNDLTGGTYLSAPLVLINQSIEKEYSPQNYNIYVIQASDTDNFPNDTSIFVGEVVKLLKVVQFMVFISVDNMFSSPDYDELIELEQVHKNFTVTTIINKRNVIREFADIFHKRRNK